MFYLRYHILFFDLLSQKCQSVWQGFVRLIHKLLFFQDDSYVPPQKKRLLDFDKKWNSPPKYGPDENKVQMVTGPHWQITKLKGNIYYPVNNYNYVEDTKVSVSIKKTNGNKCTWSEMFLFEILKQFSAFYSGCQALGCYYRCPSNWRKAIRQKIAQQRNRWVCYMYAFASR